MNSIGNDVVALAGINPERTRQYRFYSKILSPAEQDNYPALQLHSLSFEHYVWLLWSVKESAYKFVKRLQPDLMFSPTKIIVENINCAPTGQYQGTVSCNQVFLRFQSDDTDNYIHTVVSNDTAFGQIHFKVQRIAQTDHASQSAAVRHFVIKELATLWPGMDITIRQHSIGYPEILVSQKKSILPLSFSHDGNYVAYAYLLATAIIC